MRKIIALAACLVSAGPALAAMEYDQIRGLGKVIAYEGICGLTYDQAAITAFIEANTPADDLEFLSTLELALSIADSETPPAGSARTAMCAQIRQLARTHGFVD